MTRVGIVAGLVVLVVAACGPRDDGWVPVMEDQPPTYLEDELATVAREVAEARQAVRSAPADAERSLEAAAARLESLTGAFLPLYRARLDAANAYRYHTLGRSDDVGRALDRVDAVLAELGDTRGGTLAPELEQLSAVVARARMALESGSQETGPHLKLLAEQLTDLTTRAGLVL